MTSVITEADRLAGAPAPFDVLFGQDDGATRIWMISMVPGLGEQRLVCGAGQLVVIPPNTVHGVAVIDDDTEVEAIGEIGMGEWITVIDAEGRSELAIKAGLPPRTPRRMGCRPRCVPDEVVHRRSSRLLLGNHLTPEPGSTHVDEGTEET